MSLTLPLEWSRHRRSATVSPHSGVLRAGAVLLSSLLALPALAAPVCAPLDEEAFLSTLADARQALLDADVAAHERVMTGLQARIPCFAFVPSPESWAELLVGVAIVAHATGEDWQSPLTTALTVHPRVDRLVGEHHPLATWSPPPRPASDGPAVPDGVRVYCDGEIVTRVPPSTGWHLVQRRTGDGLATLLLVDEPIPEDWLDLPPLASARRVWTQVGLSGGYGGLSQAVSEQGAWLADADDSSVSATLSVEGAVPLSGSLAVRYRVVGAGEPRLAVGAALGEGPLVPWVGATGLMAGVATDGESQSLVVPGVVLGADLRREALRLGGQLSLAPWWQGVSLQVEQGLGEGPAFGGLTLGADRISLTQGALRTVSQARWQGGLVVGLRWGGEG
ncbi:MAG: hypothetical protein JXX28_12410 [Deltaproteobacteria bacterium]|nr:hypothetical protein [Deltaproteobacteria bacterium]